MTAATPIKPSRLTDPPQRCVLMSSKDVEDARRLLAVLGESRPPSEAAAQLGGARTDGDRLRRRAREIYDDRRRRSALFGPQMFGEPAWEMLLILYLEEGGERLTQARLAELSGTSRSGAFRWISFLEGRGFIEREAHPTDKRHLFVQLSQTGRDRLELFLSGTCC